MQGEQAKAEDCKPRCCTRLRGSNSKWDMRVVPLAAIFPPVIFGTHVDCKCFESGTVFNAFFVLCIELLSIPLIQINIQQKLGRKKRN